MIDARIKVPWRDDEDDPEVAIPEGFEKYDALYGYGQLMNLTLDQLVDDMRHAGVSDSFLMAEHEWGARSGVERAVRVMPCIPDPVSRVTDDEHEHEVEGHEGEHG